MKVNGKVVVVTGAGSGIGRELTLRLLARGASVVGVDLSQRGLDDTANLAKKYQRFAGFALDVTDKLAVDALPDQVVARFGAVDAVINNAGIIQPFVPLSALEMATIERLVSVNLYGVLHVIKAFLPHLLRRPAAHIVNVSSMGGFLPVPGQTLYCATKAAVRLLSEGLAAELADTAVRISTVFPGAVATNIKANSASARPTIRNAEHGTAMPPSKAARLIVRGMERDRQHILIGRDAWFMDKAVRFNPGWAARLITQKMRAVGRV